MSELSAITLESVSRFEKGVTSPLLKSITADLKKGQLIAVVGADGACKTTLMRVMAESSDMMTYFNSRAVTGIPKRSNP